MSSRTRHAAIRTITVLLGLVGFSGQAGGASLGELVAKAKKEEAVSVTVTSSMTGRTTPKLAAAFKKRFGLDNLRVTITPVLNTTNYPKEITATKAGTVPTYDAIEGSDMNNVQLLGVGGVQKIDGWEALLAEINPLVKSGKANPRDISPGPLAGYGFGYLTRVKALHYNPNLISVKDLPKTHAELGDPKYKGKWVHPPWTSHWDIGPFVFPESGREKWLGVARKAGQNAGAVLQEQAGVQRVLLGEFSFALANEYYYFAAKTKDPTAPLEVTFFTDYNQGNGAYYIVRKGARSPAAATLFTLWMNTPEAAAIWQPDIFGSQYKWGESELDKKVRQLIKRTNAKVVDMFESDKGREFLEWYGTEDGREYRKRLSQAIRGQ